MPEAILKFNLPEEQSEFDITSNAGKYYSVLWDLDQYLRNCVKYPTEGAPKLLTNTMADVRDELHSLMKSYHIDFDI